MKLFLAALVTSYNGLHTMLVMTADEIKAFIHYQANFYIQYSWNICDMECSLCDD